MSLMISSGMNITDALDLAQESTENTEIKEKISNCKELYEAHKPLDEALRDVITSYSIHYTKLYEYNNN